MPKHDMLLLLLNCWIKQPYRFAMSQRFSSNLSRPYNDRNTNMYLNIMIRDGVAHKGAGQT